MLFLRLLFFFVLLTPLWELFLVFGIGRRIGLGPTLLWLGGTFVLGSWLCRRLQGRTVERLRDATSPGAAGGGVDQQRIYRELVGQAAIGLAGLLLILPGPVTDVAGLCLLLPPVRALGLRLFRWLVIGVGAKGVTHVSQVRYGVPPGGGEPASAPRETADAEPTTGSTDGPATGGTVRDVDFEIFSEDDPDRSS